MILLIALGLLAVVSSAGLSEEDVRATKFFQLVENPNATEADIISKVQMVLKDSFGVQSSPKSMYEAFVDYMTAGCASESDFIGKFTEQDTISQTEALIPTVLETLKQGEDKHFDFDNLEAFKDQFSKLLEPTKNYNLYLMRRAICERSTSVQKKSFLSVISSNIIKAMQDYMSTLKGDQQKVIHPKVQSFLTNLQEIHKEKFALISNSSLSEYIHEALSFEVKCHNAAIASDQQVAGLENPSREIYDTLSKKIFACYRLELENRGNKMNEEMRQAALDNIWPSHGFTMPSVKTKETEALIRSLFDEPLEITGSSAENKHAPIYNIFHAVFTNGIVNVNEGNADIYVSAYADFMYNRKDLVHIIPHFIAWVATNVTDQKFGVYALDHLFKFSASSIQISWGNFAYKFDNYFKSLSDEDSVYHNVLKFLIGVFDCHFPIEQWPVIKMFEIKNESVLIKFLENTTDSFKNHLKYAAYHKGVKDRENNYYQVLTQEDFEREWIKGYYTASYTTEMKKESIHFQTNFSTGVTGVDYNLKQDESQSNKNLGPGVSANTEGKKVPEKGGINDSKDPLFNQTRKDYKVNDTFGEDQEDIDESSPKERPSTPTDNRLAGDNQTPRNKVIRNTDELPQTAIDAIENPNFRDDVMSGKKVKTIKGLEIFDDIIMVDFIPHDSDCYKKIKEMIESQGH